MTEIYLIPPHGLTIYGKSYSEGVYGESEFSLSQMQQLVDLGCAKWFDITSPHRGDNVSIENKRPDDYIGPIYTILARAEYWKIPFKREEERKRYFALRNIFSVIDYCMSGVQLMPARSASDKGRAVK